MKTYIIHDYEINKDVEVRGPGLIEAMLEHLPWSTLQLDIDYKPLHGIAEVTDKATGFRYTVKW